MSAHWRVGLASPRVAGSRAAAVTAVGAFLAEAAAQQVAVVCFPETFLPGYRGADFPDTPPVDQVAQEAALTEVAALARQHQVAVILPMEWSAPNGLRNVAVIIDRAGTVLGQQAKNQIPPEEESFYVPGERRQLFTLDGVRFGITICHEGWRYPEATRWAVHRGAQVVFHPQLTGSDQHGIVPRFWGDPEALHYEKIMATRAVENGIYFASVNFAFQHQESATSLIDPAGRCVAHTPYGESALLVADLDLSAATGWCAHRYAPERYGD